MRPRLRCAVVLGAAALLTALSLDFVGAETRNRGLQRLLERNFTAEQSLQIERGYRAAQQAGLQERRILDLVETCVDADFEAPAIARMLSLAAQLNLERLPVESFVAKIEEGIAKRVPPERVLQAAERRALMLNRARTIVNGAVLEGFDLRDRDEILPDVAAALEAGVSAEAIRRILVDSLEAGDGVGDIRRKLFP